MSLYAVVSNIFFGDLLERQFTSRVSESMTGPKTVSI